MANSSNFAKHLNRRRFIQIAAGAVALPSTAFANTQLSTVRWRGIALGAPAELTLVHSDQALARAAIRDCVGEINRLENIFSIYEPNSALSKLNGMGQLTAPPFEMLELLSLAEQISNASDGAFDVTVQPLFQLYHDHFSKDGRQIREDQKGPTDSDVAAALSKVGYRHLHLGSDQITLAKPRMALTLNGIAQGFISDKIGDLLRRRGFDNVSVSLGEVVAIGHSAKGNAWQVELDQGTANPTRVELTNAALASSAASGHKFDASGQFHHLLDPRNGRPAAQMNIIHLQAPNAALADGLSTALAIMSEATGLALLKNFDNVRLLPNTLG